MVDAKDVGPKYDISVRLIGEDGNAFVILGAVDLALKRAGIDADERGEFQAEATAADDAHLLRTCMAWVNVQ